MKVLTSAQMRVVDERTAHLGIAGPILMENAGHRVVEFLAERYAPLSRHRVVVLCGKGNNGGDGFVAARQLYTRFRLRSLHIVAAAPDAESEPLRMLQACGCAVTRDITPSMRAATLVVDAVLGTGLAGQARGRALDLIREINTGFPGADVVAVDIPSGMNSDSGESAGEIARADACVTFTAPKVSHALAPNCERLGHWRVGHIGSPASLMDDVRLHLTGPEDFRELLLPRVRESNKGLYGHVLVAGSVHGKAGAAEMAGIAALRAGAGLVTVSSSANHLWHVELMTASLPASLQELRRAAERKNVIAIGPGLGAADNAVRLVREAVVECEQSMVVDADGLNALAGYTWSAGDRLRVLTPHPGEMARLADLPVAQVQADRLGVAQRYAERTGAVVVLKGNRTVIAFPNGDTWINPTGSPAMASGGTGDILTGLIAGLLAQFEQEPEIAVLAGVYLHGLAGELGAKAFGEKPLIATDLLNYLPEALRECSRIPNEL